jgi:hypothetical protein
MKIVNQDLANFNFKFIPRSFNLTEVFYTLKDKANGNTFTSETFAPNVEVLGYLSFTMPTDSITLSEGSNLTIDIYNGLKVVYRGEIYCTNQTDLQNYTLRA